MAVFVGRRTVLFNTKRSFIWPTMVTIAVEAKQQLAVGDLLHFRRAGTKRRLQIFFPQIIGFSHMAVYVDDPHCVFRHAYLRSRKTSSTGVGSTKNTMPC